MCVCVPLRSYNYCNYWWEETEVNRQEPLALQEHSISINYRINSMCVYMHTREPNSCGSSIT